MYYQQSPATDYGGIERKVLPTNGHFIDSEDFVDHEPTRVRLIRVRDHVQAKKIFYAYLELYGHESRKHVLMKGNRLHLSIEGLSKLEECARRANVRIRPKSSDYIRR